jgi:ribosomal-protein-alanine N-acetyltransferase
MNALWSGGPSSADAGRALSAMTAADVDTVMAIESGVYAFPWTRGNFIDSLAAGYIAQLLRVGVDTPPIGYFVAMAGVDETHLLNITVAAPHQRQGHARFMMSRLTALCGGAGSHRLWLEVRESNAAARAAYGRLGFHEKGTRPGYYPAAHGQRESAVVMSLILDSDRQAGNALD